MLRGGVCTGAEAGAGAQGWLMGLAMVARAGEVRQGGAATLLRLRVSQVSAPQQQRGQSGPRARGRSSEPAAAASPPNPPPTVGASRGSQAGFGGPFSTYFVLAAHSSCPQTRGVREDAWVLVREWGSRRQPRQPTWAPLQTTALRGASTGPCPPLPGRASLGAADWRSRLC